jgi:hypothetical protein
MTLMTAGAAAWRRRGGSGPPPPPPGFPEVLAITTGVGASASTTHAIPISAPNAGDLLVVLLNIASSAATFTPPAGTWNSATPRAQGANSLHIFWKAADGSEGSSITFTSSESARRAAIVWRIKAGTWGAVAAETSAAASGNPNPPSLAPGWGVANILWLAVGTTARANTDFTAFPFADNQTEATNTSAGVGTARAAIAACSAEIAADSADPGAFTYTSDFGTDTNVMAATIGVRPAA